MEEKEQESEQEAYEPPAVVASNPIGEIVADAAVALADSITPV
jgi:hypothetical protein